MKLPCSFMITFILPAITSWISNQFFQILFLNDFLSFLENELALWPYSLHSTQTFLFGITLTCDVTSDVLTLDCTELAAVEITSVFLKIEFEICSVSISQCQNSTHSFHNQKRLLSSWVNSKAVTNFEKF